MNIAKVTKADKKLYFELVHEFYNSEAVLHTIPEENIENTFMELIRSEKYTKAYIIEENGRAAGYVLTARHFSQEAGGEVIWIDELYVREEFRDCGIGSAVFEKLFEEFADSAAFRLEIEPDNVRAKKLYERLGFENLGYSQMIRIGKKPQHKM